MVNEQKIKILITGGGGYIGSLLTDFFLRDPEVEKVLVLDLKDASIFPFPKNSKLVWFKSDLTSQNWQNEVLKQEPIDVVIHSAFILRRMYGKKGEKLQEKYNIQGFDNLVNFVFKNKIKNFICFGSAASYGARKENRIDYKFKETDLLKEETYLYGIQKKTCEEHLRKVYEQRKATGDFIPQIRILRPVSIIGPKGRKFFKRFGLIEMFTSSFFPFIFQADKNSLRQFIYEGDVVKAATMFVKEDIPGEYEVYNLAPPDYLLFSEIAKMFKKITLPLPKFLVRLIWRLSWHLTRGRIPLSPDSANSFIYPIILDGAKITQQTKFQYQYNSSEALLSLNTKKGY